MFKLCPWGEKRPHPQGGGGHLFYIEQETIGNDKALDYQTNREDEPEE